MKRRVVKAEKSEKKKQEEEDEEEEEDDKQRSFFFFFFLGYKAFNPPVQDAILLKKNCNVRLCKMCF